ncbi:MAG TPA: D-aminoacylase [Gemmatimonadaceae bacterium]|nr:D-aminoacylase [Gemmatimonadaceae bacterium]
MPTRRQFLAESGTFLALAGLGIAPAIHLPGRKRYDILIRNGHVFDGLGHDATQADVAIAGGRIAAIAPRLADDTASDVIDARGLAVAPGFIDIHSHADGTMFEDPRVESVIREGVTTVIVGQDGSSRAPARADRVSRKRGIAASMREMFRDIDALPSSVNVASMVGLGTVREVVIGDDDRPATPEELRTMIALVEAALDDGACGASTGLEYVPGEFAPVSELIALSSPLAARGLPYATHMRNEDDRLLKAIDEAITVASGANCPLEISHIKTEGKRNWGKIDDVFARITHARDQGLDVTFDRYPYTAYQTGLSNLFPDWSENGGSAAFVKRLGDPSLEQKLRTAVMDKITMLGGWDSVLISSVSNGADHAAEGQRLGTYAKSLGKDPYDVAVGLLTRSHDNVGMVGFAMSEDNIARFLQSPLCTVCSDGSAVALSGPAHSGHPHPRSLGTFPRVLGRYVREKHVLTLPQAIHKMTGATAARVKLADRGRLAPGLAADVVVFDPATVIDRATYVKPFQYPEGITAVIVNGAVAVREGQRGSHRTGHTLRPDTAHATPSSGGAHRPQAGRALGGA